MADAQGDQEPGLDVREAPWVLGQVCAYWRRVALSTPQLWWKIDINLEDRSGPVDYWVPWRPKNMIHLVDLLLQRSGNCLLTVRVGGENDLASHPALDMVMKESHRWEHVWLYLSVPLLRSLAGIKGRLQSLRTLELYPSQNVDGPLALDAFQIAPLLDSVKAAYERTATILLPWEQMRYYFSECEDLLSFSTSLNAMRNLVICHIEPHYRGELVAPAQIHLPHLRTLHILEGSLRPGARAVLVNSFTVPELEELKIECCKGDHNIISHLIALVLRSSCSLRKFWLKTPAKISDEILQFFVHTPTLAVLTLRASLLTRGVAQRLARVADSHPGLLPVLQTLLLDAEFPSREVVKMVRSRIDRSLLPEGASDSFFLEGLSIKEHPRMGGAAFDALFEMRKKGLTVEVLDSDSDDDEEYC
jgi:hypothetical protein